MVARQSYSPAEIADPLARESHDRLSGLTKAALKLRIEGESEPITLPAAAVGALVDVLEQLGRGNAVTIVPRPAELSLREAADFLGTSERFLLEKADSGAVPTVAVGSVRRIRLDALEKYRREMYDRRLSALEEMTSLDQELGLA